jgi:hypothetical protein
MTPRLCVLHEDIAFRRCHLRWAPHSMTEKEAQCRVTFSEELLQVARYAKETSFEYLSTGGKSWFYYGYPNDSAWVPSRPLFRLEKHRKFKSNILGFHHLTDVRHSHSFCFPCRDAMRSSLVHRFCLTSKRISATVTARKHFDVRTPISIMHQPTRPSARGKALPKSKPPGSCIRLILLILHSVVFSCLVA